MQELKPDYEMYDAVLSAFTLFMRDELEANYTKGDRSGKEGWANVCLKINTDFKMKVDENGILWHNTHDNNWVIFWLY